MKKVVSALISLCLLLSFFAVAVPAGATGDGYAVTFDGNGGLPVSTESAGTGSGTALPGDPQRQGFLFNGWNTAQDGGGAVFTAKTAVTSDLTVWAQWKEDGYPVYYNANGGTPALSVVNGSVNGPVFPAEPSREGYGFIGYNTKADGSGTAFTNTIPVTAPVTVYAQWEPVEHTVTFNGSGGNPWNPADSVAAGTLLGTAFPATAPTRDGYLFTGWSTTAGGTADFTPETPVTGDVTVFAAWAEDGYSVCFLGNGGAPAKTLAAGTAAGAALPAAPTREGYTFKGWYLDAGGGTPFFSASPVMADTFVYAVWEKNTYPVTFDGNGGAPASAVKQGGVDGTVLPQEPVSSGFTFAGWNTKADGTGTAFTAATPVTAPVTVYAGWSPCYVKFDGTGGAIMTTDPNVSIYDDVQVCLVRKPETGALPMPTIYSNKPGYTFKEWNTKADGSGAVFTASTPVTGNLTVYAVWEKSADTYTVTFYDGYGTFSNGEQTITAQGSVDGVLFPQPPTRPGFEFAYYTKSDGVICTESTPITEPVTLYANFIKAYTPGAADWAVTNPSYTSDPYGNGTETITIAGYTGSGTAVVMPSEYTYQGNLYTVAGNTVPKFEGSANTITYKLEYSNSVFEDNYSIVSVTMPDGLTQIPMGTFYNCINLRTVSAPSTVKYVGYEAFRNCISLQSLNLPEFVDEIGSFAFANCIRLADITAKEETVLPAGLAVVNEYAFYRSGLSGALDLSSLSYLDGYAFAYCQGLTGVTFQNDINVGAYASYYNAGTAFRGCSNLAVVNLGALSNVPYDMFLGSGIETLTIPATVTAIGSNAFTDCDRLVSVVFPGGLVTVGNSSGAAFSDCDRLVSIEFPSGVKTIEKSTFPHCDSLETVVLPEGLETLGQYAFSQCYALRDVTIPETLTSLNHPFGYDYNMTSIYYPMDTPPAASGPYEYTNSTQYNGTGTKLYYPVTGNAAWEAKNPVTAAYFPSPAASNFWFPVSNATLHNYDGSTTHTQLVLDRFTLKGTAPEPISREGMTFLGWCTVQGDPATLFDFTATQVTADLELYDLWAASSYTVTYRNAYNGSTYAIGGTDPDGTTDLPATDPAREGYRFAGWNTVSDGTGEFVTGSTVFTGDTDLYSLWEAAQYPVQFLSGGGSPFASNQKGSVDGTALPANMTRTGYTLAGWKTAAGAAFSADTPVTEATTVYAQWTKSSYTVTFNGNGGTPASTVATGGIGGVAAPGNPALENRAFTGWNTAANGGGSWYAAGAGILQDTTYYAQWEPVKHTVTFNAQGGEFETGASQLGVSADHGSKLSAPAPAPVWSGHLLLGWYTGLSYADEWAFDEDTVTGNIILFAKWVAAADLVTLTFDPQGGTVSPTEKSAVKGESCGTLPTPTQNGYTFGGWYSAEGVLYTASSAVPDGDMTLYAKWTAASSGGSTAGTQPTVTTTESGGTSTASVSLPGTADPSTGAAAAVLPSSAAAALVKAAQNAEAEGKNAVVELIVTSGGGTSAVSVTIPETAFDTLASSTDAALKVDTGIGTVTFNAESLETISQAAEAGDITISIGTVDRDTLSAGEKALVGDRPVYDFNVLAGGTRVSALGGRAEIRLPYTLQEGEDPGAVVVYYLDDSGSLQTVRGAYDEETGTVSFTTDHFSRYVIGYNEVDFSDVPVDAWYADAVGFIAARGITAGTGNGTFSPDKTLTRGQLLVFLMRAYGIDPDENPADNFADAGATYYTGYLAAAKRLGIAAGTGGNLFRPEDAVSRQDMCTLIYRTLDLLGELPGESTGTSLSDFSDYQSIAESAQAAMERLVSTGMVSGSGGKLDPNGVSTRAQMAQVLYNLLSAD